MTDTAAAGTGGTDTGSTGATTADSTDGFTPETSTEDTTPPPIDPGFGDDTADPEQGDPITLKVNGKELQLPLNEVIAAAQRELAAGGKLEQVKKQQAEMQTAQALIEKQKGAITQLVEVLKNGDIETIAEFADTKLNQGDAFKKAVIQYAIKLYEYSKMSPEQRETVEAKKELSRLKTDREARDKQDAERAFNYQVNQWTQHINSELPKAFKEVGLADTQFTRNHVVATWKNAVERGQNPTASAVVAHVKQQLEEAKMLGNGAAPPQQRQSRPRATAASVGAKPNGADSPYISFSEMQKARGRR